MSVVSSINEEYFGKNRSKNYLKDDFSRVLQGVVQRSVLIDVLSECSKARHSEEKRVDDRGHESIASGDFDPDNAGFLWSIYDTYQKGMMVDVRQLLVPEEKGAGGKFVKDVARLKTDDFMDYYKTDKAYTLPPLLLGVFLEEREVNKKLPITVFVDSHRDEIESVVNLLVKKATEFHGKGYFNLIVKDYQALKFHKDNQPEKYDVIEEVEEFGIMKTRKTTRRDKARIEITKIAEYLNGFAEIISLYQNLVSSNTSFYGSSWPLKAYVARTFALFAKEVPDDIKDKVSRDVVKYLDASLRVVAWSHEHPERDSKT
jgi:hypothetical protein